MNPWTGICPDCRMAWDIHDGAQFDRYRALHEDLCDGPDDDINYRDGRIDA